MIIARIGCFVFNGDLNQIPYNMAVKAQAFIKTFKPEHEKACFAEDKAEAAARLAAYMTPVITAKGLDPALFGFCLDIKEGDKGGMFWDESYNQLRGTEWPLVRA